MLKLKGWEVPISITMIFFGIILTVQFNTQKELLSTLEQQKPDDLVTIVKNLNDKRGTLLKEITDLDKQHTDILTKSKTGESLRSSMDGDARKLQMAIGAIPLEGPGISISITTSDTSLMYLDMVDLINELWATGAEAVSINDFRVLSSTSITDIQDGNKTAVAIKGKKLLSPIVIKAIGDAKTLETGLTFSGGIVDNLSTLYNIHPEIRQETKLIIPAKK